MPEILFPVAQEKTSNRIMLIAANETEQRAILFTLSLLET